MAPNPYLKAIAPDAARSKPAPRRSNGGNAPTTAKTNGSAAAATKQARAPVDETLRQEILALGGDDADLDLLAGIDSDSELEGGDDDEDEGEQQQPAARKANKAGLLKDLKSFVKGLDFKAAGAAQPAEDDFEEQADQSDDDDSEQEEEVRAAAPVAAPVAPAPESTKKESKVERETRRREEREAQKEAERLEKDAQRTAKDEKKQAKLVDVGGKSPWIVDPTPNWFAVPTVTPLASASRPKPELVSSMHARGQTLLTKENELYSASLDPKGSKSGAAPAPNGLSKSDQVFIQQILTSGTSSDRISALVLLVSSSPLHTTSFLDQLAGLCRKKSRDESMRAMRSLVAWWCGEGGGAPPRKLRYFADQPMLPTVAVAFEALEKKGKHAIEEYQGISKADVERCLVVFTFEDWLKRWFFQILQSLEQMSVDPLPHPRTQAVMHLSSMLRDKPEQESNILRLLVNKLGDTNRAIASKTSHHLLQVLQTHPGMTPILVREVAALVLRPRAAIVSATPAASTSHVRFGDEDSKGKKDSAAGPAKDTARDNARYYGVVTLNQVMLKKEQGEVAAKMVDVYFEVFSDVLGRLPDAEEDEKEKGSGDEAAAAQKGKKRARDDGKKQNGKKGGKKGGKQAAAEHDDAVNDVDSKLVAAVLTGINRAFPFAKLDDAAFKQRLDTLFRITHTSTFNVSIQALLLIFRVTSNKQEMADRFYRALYASMHDPRLANSSKQALYLNLVFRATKQDKDANRVAAFVKRLIQLLANMDTTFVLGGLFVVGELLATVQGLRTLISVPEKVKMDAVKESQAKLAEKDRDSHATDAYDGRKRDPKYAHAENSCLWELVPLLSHWHPTVCQYADAVLSGDVISATSDLEQYSLMAFLDRFIYREAKKSAASRGSSMMQPGLAHQDRSNRVVLTKGAHAHGAAAPEAVNSDRFRRQNVRDVSADQVFFHKFFTSKAELDGGKATAATKRKSRRGGKGSDDEDDDEGVASDADSIVEAGGDVDGAFDDDDFAAAMAQTGEPDAEADETDDEMEEEIWKAMKKSMPKAKGDSDLEDLDGSDVDDDDDDDVAMYHYSESEEEKEQGGGAGGKAKAANDDDEEDDDNEPPFKSAFEDSDVGEDDPGFLELDDDVLGSDDDVPLGAGSDSDSDSDDGAPSAKKRKGSSSTTSAEKRKEKKKLKQLPTFASADDYAHLLGGSDDEDI
ncbi:hypothetical protein BMF94_4928 [Rhodotorula taiwanensis]|uniref:CCAAT-binding factor domain-containing protein n=1 Tax=Rhodotorula taiwanensis TaxID=741276 RepID=A0A2S5B5K4_9BASI|nr:hypothetical protein BMF94_4928 [Rhodotorula taiwanensis]